VEEFARALPVLRAKVDDDLALDDMPKERAIAIAVRLLDRATFRIGSETYAERNGSFGLATMRKADVHVDDGTIVFDYVAKGGARRVHHVDDADIVPLVERLKRRRSGGAELLAFRDGTRWRDLRSGDINAYLKDVVGPEHSAKDFRTWHATVLAAVDLARVDTGDEAATRRSTDRAIVATVRRVADHLGNTPAVCRASYIDPRVFDRFREGRTVRRELSSVDVADEGVRDEVEAAVLGLLDRA
jgi:DNA topoisomerase IB